MRFLDLFSGIGGFALGLERAGHETVAFCEIEPYCRAVLKKHWPAIPCYEDIRLLTAERLAADGIAVDAICGGFPCQDISFAGKAAGIEGERSGLWSDYRRLIGELRPRYVIVENVSALLSRGLDKVLGDLAALRYDAEWHCIPASAVGAPHRRDRVWIVAYPRSGGRDARDLRQSGDNGQSLGQGRSTITTQSSEASAPLADPDSGRRRSDTPRGNDADRADAGWQEADSLPRAICEASGTRSVADASGPDVEGQRITVRIQAERSAFGGSSWWSIEPDMGRVAHGVSSRVDRLKGLGNAVVPQIPEIIGLAIND